MMVQFTSDGSINFEGFLASFDARPAQHAADPQSFPGSFEADAWHHVAVSLAAEGTLRYLLDGELSHTTSVPRLDSVGRLLRGGFSVGQRFLGPEERVAGRFDGSIDQVRMFADAARVGLDLMKAGCQDVESAASLLLLCLGFEEGAGSTVSDGVGGSAGVARGVVGDKHMPWCYTMDGAGAAGRGSWGFCSGAHPRLPGAGFEYDDGELLWLAQLPLRHILVCAPCHSSPPSSLLPPPSSLLPPPSSLLLPLSATLPPFRPSSLPHPYLLS